MINQKAFTFAELMISLVIIAVITALLYPTISEISPNNNKQLFRSAYKTIELTVQDIMMSGEDISSNTGGTTPQEKLCNAFKSRLNSVSWTDGATTRNGCDAGINDLRTSNGMRWWFQDYDAGTKTHTIYVDVNASNNGAAASYRSKGCGASCDKNINMDTNPDTGAEIAGTGTPNPKRDPNELTTTHWATGCFRDNNSTMRDTFKILITDEGVVDPRYDDQASYHLRDESN